MRLERRTLWSILAFIRCSLYFISWHQTRYGSLCVQTFHFLMRLNSAMCCQAYFSVFFTVKLQ